MAKSIKIGSLWIELSEDNHLDAPRSEASSLHDVQPEQQPSNNTVIKNSEVNDMMISAIDDDNEVELVKNTVGQIVGPAEEACPSNEMAIQICRTSELIKVSKNSPTIEVEDTMKASNNLEDDDDDELRIPDKGKGKMEETNEGDSDSSSSWNEENLPFASHTQLFPRDPLLFGEGASKFFEENSVPYGAIDDDDDDDDIVMDDNDEIFGYESMCFDSDIDEEELKRNHKKRKWG